MSLGPSLCESIGHSEICVLDKTVCSRCNKYKTYNPETHAVEWLTASAYMTRRFGDDQKIIMSASDKRKDILAQQEISDPPTWAEVRTFLADPELDFTPTDLSGMLRDESKRQGEIHPSRGCIGCEICSERWVLEHAADYIDTMVAMLDALEEQAMKDGELNA